MSELFTVQSLVAFLTLASLEIVLGIDNVVFIAILSSKLPPDQRQRARVTGLALAAFGRILLLFGVAWIITLEKTALFTIPDWEFLFGLGGKELSAKDVILLAGGLFLVGKATWEIHHNLEGVQLGDEGNTGHGEKKGHAEKKGAAAGKAASQGFSQVIGQILVLDLVFSIDSVLTAVGMVDPKQYTSGFFPGTEIPWPPLLIMVLAVLSAIAVMLLFAGPLSRFIEHHPTMKMLALSFLLLIGVVLVAEGLHTEIPRGYIYFAMGFSLFVELINLKFVRRGAPRPTLESEARAAEEPSD